MPNKIPSSSKKNVYYKCTHCGDEIYWNTHRNLRISSFQSYIFMLESFHFMDIRASRIQKAFDWLAKENGENFLMPDEYCPTRDVFQVRLEKMNIFLKNDYTLNDIASLVVVIIGEIGNNAFDHNLGNWRDEAGRLFGSRPLCYRAWTDRVCKRRENV